MMASARRRAANQDLPRHPSSSLSTLMADNTAGSISMDDLLKNIYSEADPPSIPSPDPHPSLFHTAAGTDEDKGMDEVWEDIVAGHGEGAGRQHPTDGGTDQQMTLEDFLSKAATKHPVEVGGAARAVPGPSFMVSGSLIQPQGGQLGVGGGRGKRRAAVQAEPPVDKTTQQKQRRMIKNRESAARSRERKQAYTIELESLVTQLEEENSRLLREETMWYSDEAKLHEENREKLVKVVIPVTEGRRPPRTLHRVHSM